MVKSSVGDRGDLPIVVIADPDKTLHGEFAVGSSNSLGSLRDAA